MDWCAYADQNIRRNSKVQLAVVPVSNGWLVAGVPEAGECVCMQFSELVVVVRSVCAGSVRVCVTIAMAGWLHGVCVGACWVVSPQGGFSLSLFCNY